MDDYIEYPERTIRRVAKDPGLWSALDDVLEVIAARGEESR